MNLGEVRRVLYRLPELIAADPAATVYVPEGEKDVDTLRRHGHIATCNPGGAGKFKLVAADARKILQDRNVVIISDADDVGRRHAREVYEMLLGGSAQASIRALEPPHPHKDVSDLLAAGGTLDMLVAVEAPVDDGAGTPKAPDKKEDANKEWVKKLLLAIETTEEPLTTENVKAAIESAAGDGKRAASTADMLVGIARSKATLFHDQHDTGYAAVLVQGHVETLKLRSSKFRSWLEREFYLAFEKVPGGQAKADAIGVLDGLAVHGGDRRNVYVRVAAVDRVIYIDLANETREVAVVDETGWKIVTDCPVAFVRPNGMSALPRPTPNGSIQELKRFINLKDDDQFVLLVAWCVCALRGLGPYPILTFEAEHGAGKSTASRFVRSLIDPNTAPIRTAPREERDLAVTSRASHVIALDNLSGVHTWLSDALCRIATGAGLAIRALYSDDDEILFNAKRPVIVNGIDSIATRADLADRSLVLNLPTIPKDRRVREKKINRDFEASIPSIFGALLSALVGAIGNEESVDAPELPRMADFAVTAIAAEDALGFEPGSFLKAFAANRKDAITMTLEADPVATAVIALTENASTWSGSASSLLVELGRLASDDVKKERDWPRNANTLSNRLRRAAPSLRSIGIEITNDAKARPKTLHIRKSPASRTGAQEIDAIDGIGGAGKNKLQDPVDPPVDPGGRDRRDSDRENKPSGDAVDPVDELRTNSISWPSIPKDAA
jgi:5S rRNA maturation endonuclease (ribonuclease M5)